MPFDNIKELARQYALAHKTKKSWVESMIAAAEKELLTDDINDYKTQKIAAEQEIKSRYNKKDALFWNFQIDTDKVKDLYLNDIKEQVDFVSKEKVNFQTLVSWSASLQEQLPHFQEIVADNIDKINSFASNLNNLQADIQKDATKYVSDFKQEIKDWLKEEKKTLSDELRAYYEEKKEKIDLKLNENKKEKFFWKEWFETFKEMEREWIFVKYFLIIIICLVAAFLDFALIRNDLWDAWWANGLLASWFDKLVYSRILPLMFSLWFIFVETINYKVIKSKFVNTSITIVIALFSLFLLVFPPFMMRWNGATMSTWEYLKAGARFLVYFLLVPASILLIYKYVHRNYLKIYLSNIIRWFCILFSPIIWIINLIRRIVQPVENRVYINLAKFKIKFTWAPRNELEEKLQLANVFFNNMNLLESQITQIKNYTQSVVNQFEWGNQVFDKRIENLREGFSVINQKLNEQIQEINDTKNREQQNIQNIINWIMDELWQTEDDIKQARLLIKEWVLEAMNEN